MSTPLTAEEEVRRAWNDPGRNPTFHRQAQADLLRSWPSLARAVARLAAEPSEEGKQR